MFKIFRWPWKFFKKQHWLVKIIIVVSLIAVATLTLRRFWGNQQLDYELEAARFDSITEIVSETGNVTTAGVTPIYSTTTGMVDQVFVSNGDYVTKDQVLLTVKATATRQEQDAALATYLSAKTALETAQATQLSLQAAMFGKWDSFKELAESDEYEDADGNPKDSRVEPEFHIPEKEWLAAEAAYKKQQVAINQAQANVSATWLAYQATQDSQVKANFSGQVRNLSVDRGSLVQVATPTTQASLTPVLVLVDDTIRPIVKLNVNETDAIKIQPGQIAKIEFDALTDQLFTGQVDRVDTVAVPSADVVTFAIYVQLDELSDVIRSGLTADVDIIVSTKENVLTVPSSAIKPYQGGRSVRVIGEDGEIEFIPVEVGSRGDGRSEIISGIDEGTEVVVALSNEQVERSSGGLF